MKPVLVIGLLVSHLLIVGLGWWLGSAVRGGGAELKPVSRIQRSASGGSAEIGEANPIFRAGADDFRAAWQEMLRMPRDANGEPHPNSLNFFVDWCGVDPEGAVLGLSELHAPRFSHNYLSNAIGPYGAELAPALARHWQKLRLQKEYKVIHAMGRALGDLAKEDPVQAAALTAGLPPGPRSKVHSLVFDDLEREQIKEMVSLFSGGDDLAEWEREAFWKGVSSALDQADSERGVWDWLAEASSPEACRQLAGIGFRKAWKGEDWSEFFDALEKMDDGQETVWDVVKANYRPSSAESRSWKSLEEEARSRGYEDRVKALVLPTH